MPSLARHLPSKPWHRGDVHLSHCAYCRHAWPLLQPASRLERIAAKRVRKVQTWWVMRDPAGLLLCVVPMSPGSLNDENARRWE